MNSRPNSLLVGSISIFMVWLATMNSVFFRSDEPEICHRANCPIDKCQYKQGITPSPIIQQELHKRNKDGASKSAPKRYRCYACSSLVRTNSSCNHGKRRLVQRRRL